MAKLSNKDSQESMCDKPKPSTSDPIEEFGAIYLHLVDSDTISAGSILNEHFREHPIYQQLSRYWSERKGFIVSTDHFRPATIESMHTM